jgi:hypothetical protein
MRGCAGRGSPIRRITPYDTTMMTGIPKMMGRYQIFRLIRL